MHYLIMHCLVFRNVRGVVHVLSVLMFFYGV